MHAPRKLQHGMSLIEIMVAVVIGLIGILIITQAYITSDNFNRSTLGEGGAQTSGLLALYSIQKDVRMAGYGIATTAALGCGNASWYYGGSYSANVASGSLANFNVVPVSINASTTTAANPDVITIAYGTKNERSTAANINGQTTSPVNPTMLLDGVYGFAAGDVVLLVKSTGCALRQVSQLSTSSQSISFAQGGSWPYNPNGWGSFPVTNFASGDTVLNLGTPVMRTYSIVNNKLRMFDAFASAAGVSNATSDLVEGIIDMRAQYGLDDGSGGGTADDGIVDSYTNVSPTNATGWGRVLNVRIGVLARIGNYEKPSAGAGGNCDATTTAPTWAGGSFPAINISTVTSQDRCYRYRVFQTTVPLRNMLWRTS
jgi:type IV pilus assembly protein PilW